MVQMSCHGNHECIFEENRKTEYTIKKDNEPHEIQDWYIQCTFTNQDKRPDSIRTNRRPATGGEYVYECQDVQTFKNYEQTWGHYCIRAYKAVKKHSAWFYIGWGLVVVGAVVLTVATFGAGGVIIKLGALAAGIIATIGSAAIGAGVSIVVGIPDDYERGEPKGTVYRQDSPIDDWRHINDEEQILRPWHPCE
ncbi:MAG: hypothetical protein M5U10_09955 [Candidatus Methanoperedens sp.]|nr:hypothetical protein [Candidatus Methanoperedens sp.]